MVDADILHRIQEVADRDEIRQALMRYCRGIDRGDEELINSAFHSDAIDDHGTPGPATELARRVASLDMQLMHFTGNILIELAGESAYVESYFISFSPVMDDGVSSTRSRAGRYLDRFERRGGEWKIAHRMVVDEWARLDPVTKVPIGPGAHTGKRSGDDPVYHLRELLK